MKPCPFCKEIIENNSIYCPHCGNDVTVGDTISECNHIHVNRSYLPNVYRRNWKAYLIHKLYYVGIFLLCISWGIHITNTCDSPKKENLEKPIQMNGKTSSDTVKAKTTEKKLTEEAPKKRELILTSGKDYLYLETLDENFHSCKLYLDSPDGSFYLNDLSDISFEYVTQYKIIGDNIHFVAGKDGYGRGMTNYYFIFNMKMWRLKKIAEGHYIKFVEGKVIVIDFDGNEVRYDLV